MRQPTTDRLDGKTALVTGANTGIGRTAAIELARRGATVLVCARSEDKARPVVDEITALGAKARPWALELGDLDAVATSARALVSEGIALDRLVLNAGLAGQQGLTKQGFELTFGVNHVGHFLFGELVMPRVRECKGRVVVVASGNHDQVDGIDFAAVRQRTRTVTGLHEYSVSKLANVMTAIDWSKLHADAGVKVVSLNPGRIASDIWRRIPNPFRWLFMQTMRTVEQGAYTTVHCAALADRELVSGAYYNDCREKPVNPAALDEAKRRALRDASLGWVGDYLR
jgi:retinol dehydrogenase-12